MDLISPDQHVADHPLHLAVIGVLVHNEDPSIEPCLQAILAERDGAIFVRSVIVVASGCTDRTEEIVRRIASEDPRVSLISELERRGKAAAINSLLRNSDEPIVVVLGGDVVFTPGSLVKLLEPFADPLVGMTGVRPLPTNPRVGLIGNSVNVLWDLHHELSMRNPKLGEAVAFRRVLEVIDHETLVDEATMEHVLLSRGFQLRYVPEAIVRNHGPETLREFVAQRTRIYEGHLALASSTGHRVSSMNFPDTARAAWKVWRRGHSARYMLVAMAIEAMARTRARLMRLSGRRSTNGTWQPILTSKRVLGHGHVLRAHHEGVHKVHFLIADVTGARAWVNRAAVLKLKRSIRVDDRIRLHRGQLTVLFRTDESGAVVASARLHGKVPGLLHPSPDGSGLALGTPTPALGLGEDAAGIATASPLGN